jgi:chitinase
MLHHAVPTRNAFVLGLLVLVGATGCASDASDLIAAPSGSLNAARQKRTAPSAPSAPAAPTAVAGDAQATVSWQPPARTGTSPISAYTVTSNPGAIRATADGATTQTVVTGLTNGVSYTFTVVATNGAGDSPASLPSNAVTPSAASPPAAPSPAPTTTGRWVSGYYVGYQRSLYPETSVDFTTMTHVILGAAQATPTGGVTTDFYVDNTNGPIMAKNLSARAHAAGRKAIMMIGGEGHRDNLHSATTSAYRATFVSNLLKTLDDLGYDGIDVDWEPVYESDKPQLLQFLKDLRAARPGMLLTFPVDWARADAWYAQAAAQVDQLNLMTYQMADNWGGWVSWQHAALTGDAGDRPSSVSRSVTDYRNVGVPAAKLGIGVATSGSCWRGVSTMYQTLDGTTARVVASDNVMSFANIMAQYYTAGAYRWDDAAKSGYLSFTAATGPQGCTMVSYEDERSVQEKGAWVKANGVGGAIVWTVQQGHLTAPLNGSQDPLMRSLYDAMMP